ncbi:haptoglobin [Diretmus argenteus]
MAHTEALRLPALRSRRMIGGTLAPHVPWQALVYLNESWFDGGFAGGALISDRWVLTAGRNLFVNKTRHDTQGKEPLIPKLYLGISHLSEANAINQFAVEKVVLHPHFQKQSDWDNNLALIKLKDPVTLRKEVIPIPLPERGQDLVDTEGTAGVITGWGFGVFLTPASSIKHLVLPVASHRSCQTEYHSTAHTPTVDNNMFCTGASKFEEDVCSGDGGGALVVTDPKSGGVYAAGILSYDKSCRTQKYAVYMKISSYLPWINSVLRGDSPGSSDLRSDVMSKMRAWQP